MPKSRSVVASDSPPSVEQVRQRAKHRLIGVTVLVLAAVLVFPLLFDTQPRPVPVDIPIDIPSRKAAKPLQVETPVAVAEASVAAPSAAVAAAEKEEVILESTPATKSAPVPKPEPAAREATVAKVEPPPPPPVPAKEAARKEPPAPAKEAAPAAKKEPAASSDAARALALLEGKPAPTAAASGDAAGARFIVQVGAFADADVAQATRTKLERAGLKTYTHVAQTPEGKRTRVRLGPFASRAEAEKAAAKAKGLGLAAAVLTL